MPVYIVKSTKSSNKLKPAFNDIKLNEQGFPIVPGTGIFKKESKYKVSRKYPTRLKGYVDDPNIAHRRYGHKGVIEKYSGIPYTIQRKIAREFSIVASILRLRSFQLQPFAEIWDDDKSPGIKAVLKDKDKTPTTKELKEMKELEKWFYQTGRRDFDLAVKRKDRLPQSYEKLLRDVLTFDRVAVSRRIDYTGEPVDFSIIDAATIKPVDPYIGYDNDTDIEFVQEINGTIVETFKNGEVIVDWMHQTSDVEFQYHGWSCLEESFKEIKSTISALKYNSGNFTDSKAPKGYFTLPGEVDESDLDLFEERWNALFSGVESAFRTPFFSGLEMKYNAIGASNRDMEYDKYMQLLLLLIFANFSTDPTEIGIKLDRAQQIFGEVTTDKKSDKSKDRGLGAILDFLCRIMNKIIENSKKWEKYKLIHTGRKNIDQEAKLDTDIKKLGNYMTLGEIRQENDKPSLVDLAKKMGIDDEEMLEALKKDEMLILNMQYAGMKNQVGGMEGEEEELEEEEEEEEPEEEGEDYFGGGGGGGAFESEEGKEEEVEEELEKSVKDDNLFYVEID